METKSEGHSCTWSIDNLRAFDARRDMNDVADLIEQCFADTLDQDGKRFLRQMRDYAKNPSIIHWSPLTAEWAGSPFIGYVVDYGEQILGNVSLIPYRSRGKRNYMIANVAVHPEFRRQGIAQELTEHALRHAIIRGANEVWLQVRDDNPAAINLYQRLGFHEQVRRSSWIGRHNTSIIKFPDNIEIKQGAKSEWRQQKTWLKINYPEELTWHIPLKLALLQPGVYGAINRFINNQFVRHWAVFASGNLSGVVSWQSSSSPTNSFWLAVPDDVDSLALKALLSYARTRVPKHYQITLDFPAIKHQDAILNSGFNKHHTLIWMKRSL